MTMTAAVVMGACCFIAGNVVAWLMFREQYFKKGGK